MYRSTRRRHACLFVGLLGVGAAWLSQLIGMPASLFFVGPLGDPELYNMEAHDSAPKPLSATTRGTLLETALTLAPLVVSPSTPPARRTPHVIEFAANNSTRQATIVVQLSGEMANNLHHIAHGLGIKLLAKEEYDIDCNIVIRHSEGPNNRAPRPKWKSARDHIQMCFPKLANWNFGEGNKKEFLERQNLQREWLGGRMDHMFGLINSRDINGLREGLQFLSDDILADPNRPLIDSESISSSAIRLPYLFSETLDVYHLIDRYYTQIRDLFQFNDTACCAILPGSKDSVFHFRNYESEMPERRAYDMGFAELSPSKTATELFRNLQPGDRVQITTRIFNQRARNYAEALAERGINATVITDKSAVEDFCFLKQAQKEVVGSARSTFVFWAALLGNARRARMYHVDNNGLRARHADFWERFSYNFTHPDLRDRFSFELYRAEE